jgi:hypothetical protein
LLKPTSQLVNGIGGRKRSPAKLPCGSLLAAKGRGYYCSAAGSGGSGGGGSSGSGGGRGGDEGDEDSSQPAENKKFGFFAWQGWQDRVAADPGFCTKVLIEQVLGDDGYSLSMFGSSWLDSLAGKQTLHTIVQIIGVGASVVGDMSSRPYWGLYELDFVFSTLVVSH